jgi:hypothetical protein
MGLAGVLGFEPRNGGIKIRCLTAWLYPNPWESRGLPESADVARRGTIRGGFGEGNTLRR